MSFHLFEIGYQYGYFWIAFCLFEYGYRQKTSSLFAFGFSKISVDFDLLYFKIFKSRKDYCGY